MWIFLPGGLVMPSTVPMDQADPAFTLGYRDIQVRARLVEHLEQFIADHMQGQDYSEIQLTPDRDYNARFYTTRDALKAALASTVDDLDYDKFKPSAERKNEDGTLRYRKAHKYHDALNSIWSVLTRLAPAGGSWGPKSAENPNGYEPRKTERTWDGYGYSHTPAWAEDDRIDDDREIAEVKASWDSIEDPAWDAMSTAEQREYIEKILAER